MKIIFYLNSPTSYQFDFFNNLIKKNIKVFVIYQKKAIKNFNWKLKSHKWIYFLNNESPYNQINRIIQKINPYAVIIGGYKMNYDKIFYQSKKFLLFYWLERLEKKFFLKNLIRYFYIKKKIKNVDGILAIGKDAKNYYKKFHNKVLNLPYSIEIEKYDIKKKNYGLNFLFVGQLIRRKGIDKLINIIKNEKLNNVNFTICGAGPYKKKNKKY
jgi:glycosyltransferase involved in cell wall biosynthesis